MPKSPTLVTASPPEEYQRASDLLDLLGVRGIEVPAAARRRILKPENMKHMDRWLRNAIFATSIEDVFSRRRRG